MFAQLTGALRSAPGVEAAGISSAIPLGAGSGTSGLAAALPSLEQPISVPWRSVDGDFFSALRIPVLSGRVFDLRDGPDKPTVYVLSRQAAQRFFGTADAAGMKLRPGDAVGEVIGVVGDARTGTIGDLPENVIYVPIPQGGRFAAFAVFVRTRTASPEAAATLIKERLRELDPGLAGYDYRAMRDWVEAKSALPRIRAWVLGLLAGVALALGLVGIYGVLSYLVALRKHEFGVRLALGARPSGLVGLVLGQGAWLAGVGIAIGLAGAAWLTRVLSSFLYGVSVRDPLTFGGVAVVLFSAALLACLGPARRASRADPVAALRGD
jgi:predicted permease